MSIIALTIVKMISSYFIFIEFICIYKAQVPSRKKWATMTDTLSATCHLSAQQHYVGRSMFVHYIFEEIKNQRD